MAITQDWKIRSRSHACSHTGDKFTDGQQFYTALFSEGKTGDLVRKDFSIESWNAVHSDLNPFSFWKSTYEAPPPPDAKPEVVEKESAEALLRRLIEEGEPHTENARYILAIMLERKKILRHTDTQFTEQNKLLIYEHTKTGEVFIVGDPQLKLTEVESVQAQVADLLGGGKKDEDAPGEAGGDAAPEQEPAAGTPAGEPGETPAPEAPAPEPVGAPSSDESTS